MFRLLCRNVLSITLYLIACLTALLLAVSWPTDVHAAPLTQTNGQNLQLVDRLGGQTQRVVVEGNYAYLVVNNRLSIVDISNPTSPTAVGSLGLNYDYYQMAIANNMLYIGGGDYGYHIISVSDPHYPVEVAHIPAWWAGYIAAQGHYVYWGSLEIVDAARPASPIQVGSYYYTGVGPLITVQGNYAYLLGWREGDLEIIDISNPSAPKLVSSFAIPTYYRKNLVVVDKTIYVSFAGNIPNHSGDDHLLVIDVSNPLEPKQKGEYEVPFGFQSESDSLAAAGSVLYWATNQGLMVLDAADPEHIKVEQTLNVFPSALTVAGNRLYSASLQYGLQIFDLSLPLSPSLISGRDPERFYGIVVQDGFFYNANGYEMQVRDPANPRSIVSSTDITGSLFSIEIENHNAYLEFRPPADDNCLFGFHTVDITNPLSLTVTKTTKLGCLPSDERPVNLEAIANGRVYASHGFNQGKLYVYDITTSDTPTLLATYEPSGGTIIVNGNYAYMKNRQTGMTILDVSGTSAPTFVADYASLSVVRKFAISNHYLFVSIDGYGDGLHILDIANPITPIEIGYVPGILIGDFVTDGDYVYLLDRYTGFHVFDITEPTQPIEVAFNSTVNGTQLAVTTEHRIFVSTNEGLTILQLSGTIAGKVVDSFGRAHADVKVALRDSQSAETNAQGDYSFASLTPGSYTVKVESSTYDFQPAERTLRVPSYSSDSINFTLLVKPLSTVVMPDAPTHLSYTDLVGNLLAFDMPVGMVAQPTTLKVLPQASAAAPGQFFTGVRFDLQMGEVNSASSNFTFTAPLTITLHYTDSAVAPVTDRDQLMLRWWDGSQWTDATTTCAVATLALHNLESQVLTITVCQSGQFALFGPTVQHFLPLVSRSQVETFELRGRFVAQHSGKCLNVLAESQQNGASIIQWPCVGGDNEIWTVRPQGEYAQLVAKHSQKCLNVSDASQTEGAQVIQYSCSGGDNELWRLLPVDDSIYQIVAKHSNQCLTVQDASQEDKAQVIQRNCSESQNQIWRFQAAN